MGCRCSQISGYKVYNDRATLIFSSETGALISYMTDGQELLATPLEVSLYRPVTDNDNRDRNAARPWKKAGLDRLTQKLIDFKTAKKEVTVDFELVNTQQQTVAKARMSYALATDGRLKIITVVKPDTAIVRSLARMAWCLKLPIHWGRWTTWGGEMLRLMQTAWNAGK